MSAAKITESNDVTVGATVPAFLEIAPVAAQDFLAPEALVSPNAINSTNQADQIASLSRHLREAREALYKSQEREVKIRKEKDQEIQELKEKNSALSAELAEAGKMAVIERIRAQEIACDQAQALQGLTGVLQAKQANLDEAQEALKGLRSQMTGCEEQLKMLQEQLQAADVKRSYYKKEYKTQQATVRQCAATLSLLTVELEELRASQKVQIQETFKAEKAFMEAELQGEVERGLMGSELQNSFQAKEEMVERLEKLETLKALCEERGDAAEHEVMVLKWKERAQKAKKVARRLDFSKV